MNCIIIDDEPLAREAMEMLVEENKELCLLSMFNNAVSAARFMEEHSVDLIFLDIQMPGITFTVVRLLLYWAVTLTFHNPSVTLVRRINMSR